MSSGIRRYASGAMVDASRSFDICLAIAMYRDGLTREQIALLLDSSISAVSVAFVRHGIAHTERGRASYERWAEKLTESAARANRPA
jgi:hypothetical protein